MFERFDVLTYLYNIYKIYKLKYSEPKKYRNTFVKWKEFLSIFCRIFLQYHSSRCQLLRFQSCYFPSSATSVSYLH